MPFRLVVPRELSEAMVRQAQEELPNECCGLLAGTVADGLGRVLKRYPLVNEAASPTEYACGGPSLFAAHKDMRLLGIELLAIYHSHPTSAPVPSKKDLALAFWPDTVYLIVSLAEEEPVVRGWWLTETDYRAAEWEIAG
jgi:[CysO sulfur-carrier protein]-S-L-cysteine hydrolase